MHFRTFLLALVLLEFLPDPLLAQNGATQRLFVIMESADQVELQRTFFKVRQAGKETGDFAALQTRLKTIGNLKMVNLPTRSVIYLKIGDGDTSALDREIAIDFFTGSFDGLSRRITKESGTVWSSPMSTKNTGTQERDFSTRVTVKDFRGSIRQLLAQSIPISYGGVALTVLCSTSHNRVEIQHVGNRQDRSDYFAADPVKERVPAAEIITTEETDAEGNIFHPIPEKSKKQR
jgi:hypothetical protein